MTRKRLQDEEAACNIIKRSRKANKTYLHKTYTTPIKIDDCLLLNRINLRANPRTGHITISPYGICKGGITICPTTNQKLKCTNKHALEMLEKRRKRIRK